MIVTATEFKPILVNILICCVLRIFLLPGTEKQLQKW